MVRRTRAEDGSTRQKARSPTGPVSARVTVSWARCRVPLTRGEPEPADLRHLPTTFGSSSHATAEIRQPSTVRTSWIDFVPAPSTATPSDSQDFA